MRFQSKRDHFSQWIPQTLCLAVITVSTFLSGCVDVPCTEFYHSKKNMLLSGIETGEALRAKSIVAKGWFEGVPTTSSLDSSNLANTTIYSNSDTVTVTNIIPRYRFGLDLGVAVSSIFAVGGDVMAGYGYRTSFAEHKTEFQKSAGALGFWVSVGNKFDTTYSKPRVRFTLRGIFSSDIRTHYTIAANSYYISTDSTVTSDYTFRLQPNLGVSFPLNKHLAVFTGLSASVAFPVLDTITFEGVAIHGGLSITPAKYFSLKPVIECEFLTFDKKPIPILGLYAGFNFPFADFRDKSEDVAK